MFKKLFKNSFIYVIGDLLNKAIPFLLLPTFTKYLIPSEYGLIANFQSILFILNIFISLNSHNFILICKSSSNLHSIKSYISNSFNILVIVVLSIGLFSIVFPVAVERLVLLFGLQTQHFYYLIIISITDYFYMIICYLWLINEKAESLAIFRIIKTLIDIGLSVVLIVNFGLGADGRIYSILIAGIVIFLFCIYYLVKHNLIGFEYEKASVKEIMNYSLPLIPHEISQWLRSGSDKLILTTLLGLVSVGIFSTGYQISSILIIIAASLNTAYLPFLFSNLETNTNHSKGILVNYTLMYIIFMAVISILLFFSLPYIYNLLIDSKFKNSVEVSQYLIFPFFLKGIYYAFVGFLIFFKKTKQLALITFFSSLCHAVLSYFFILQFNQNGIIISSVVSECLILAFLLYYCNKLYPLNWRMSFF